MSATPEPTSAPDAPLPTTVTSPTPTSAARELPAAPAVAETETTPGNAYRPLSVLAMVSFGIAILFAVTIVTSTLTSLLSKVPLLLPPWLILIGLGAALLGWLAQRQIQSSEGTLTGLGLTRWAIGLGLVLSPLYGAYYGATYFSVTLMAQDFSQRWLKMLANGEIDKAFWLTLPPNQRPPDDQRSRDALEAQFNIPDREGRGQVSGFRMSDLTRQMQIGGKDPTIDLVGVQDWSYEQGGYRVVAIYKISSRLATFFATVAVQGVAGEVRGRQWTVLQQSTGLSRTADSPYEPKPEAQKYGSVMGKGRGLADTWTRAVNVNQLELAFALTLPPKQGKELIEQQPRVLLMGLATGSVPPTDPETRKVLLARKAWFSGEYLDDRRLWTMGPARPAILTALRNALRFGLPNGGRVSLTGQSPPVIQATDDGGEEFGFDIQFTLPRANEDSPFVVDALLIVRGVRNADGDVEPDGIERIELLSGRTMAAQRPGR